MAVQVQTRRGTSAEHSSFTGANGEITVDTDKEVVVVHDGATVGGYPLMRENGSNSALALGSAGTPSLKFTGDTNTGIYSPGADQVAISTGGSGRLFVDASGNVKLGASAASGFRLAVDGDTWFGNQAGTEIGRIFNDAGVLCLRASSNVTGLGLATNSSSTHAIRITSAGLVGIGTSAPTSFTTIKQSANSAVGGLAIEASGTDSRLISYFDSGQDAWLLNATYGSSGAYKPLSFLTSDIRRLTIDTSGRVGIGTTTPNATLSVSSGSVGLMAELNSTNANGGYFSLLTSNSPYGDIGTAAQCVGGSASDFCLNGRGSRSLVLGTNNTERLRIDSSGRLLVGTSTAPSAGVCTVALQGNSGSSTDGAVLNLQRGVAATGMSSGDNLGFLRFGDNAGNLFAEIRAQTDAASGNNDFPGRLVFSTTADGASSPTERMRITNAGFILAGTTDPNIGQGSASSTFVSGAGVAHPLKVAANDASFTETGGGVFPVGCLRSASSAYTFIGCYSGNSAAIIWNDKEFGLRGDGNGYADGTWNGGGADYAEFFEWSDSNPDSEDRRGISVVLNGDRIREAQAGEDPIGVISGNPSVVGDAAWNKWSGKYLRDEFGTYIREDYEVEDEDGNTVVQQRRKLNPAYDPDVEYIPREQRPEWDCVGLMGKLRIRKGQITGSRWIKMRDISDSVEEWLVR